MAKNLTTAELFEGVAMKILAWLRETNMVQFLLAEQMGKDFLDWAEEFGQKFRHLYEASPEIKEAVDSGRHDPEFVSKLSQQLLTDEVRQ